MRASSRSAIMFFDGSFGRFFSVFQKWHRFAGVFGVRVMKLKLVQREKKSIAAYPRRAS